MRAALLTLLLLPGLTLTGCERGSSAPDQAAAPTAQSARPAAKFQLVGKLESKRIDEASGVMTTDSGDLYLHNDEGARLYFTDNTGRDLGSAKVDGAKNRDWEDLTRVPGDKGPLLVIGDIGDNHSRRKRISLYFVPEPPEGERNEPLALVFRR